MIGFTLFPIVFLGACQCIIAILLLAPLPVARLAINLCKATTTPVGKTFLGTISVFLLVLLVAPILEVNDLRAQATRQFSGSSTSSLELDNLHRRDAETLAYLSAVLTGFSLLMNFVLQKLGLVLGERELAKLKETTLLKQVKGLHAEYDRLSSQKSSAQAGASVVEEAKAELLAARQQLEAAQVKSAEADKKRQAAELNLDALKSQTRGLENEYDRLLATNDSLQKKLSQLQPGDTRPASKKEW